MAILGKNVLCELSMGEIPIHVKPLWEYPFSILALFNFIRRKIRWSHDSPVSGWLRPNPNSWKILLQQIPNEGGFACGVLANQHDHGSCIKV